MAKPSPGRNIPYQFSAAKFRNAIRFVFEMETDPDLGNQIVFHFTGTKTPTGHADGDKVPFDPTKTVTRIVKAPVKVPCDVQFTAASEVPTSFGSIVPAKLTVLLLDEDFDQVEDSSFVVMNGDRYNRLYLPPSFALFDVGLHEMVFQAENEI